MSEGQTPPQSVDEEAEKLLTMISEDDGQEHLLQLLRDSSLALVKENELQLLRTVGSGANGVVHEALWHGTRVAVKKLLVQNDAKALVGEARVLARLRHPHALLLIGICLQPNALAIVTEFCSGGSLWDALRRRDERLNSERCVDQTAQAMCYLHANGILHRDLKSPNVLLTESLEVRVCDFGMSRLFTNGVVSTLTAIGTPAWAAPETLTAEKFGLPCDVWSFGVIVWEAFSFAIPYDGVPPIAIAVGVANRTLQLDMSVLPKSLKPFWRAVITMCLDYEPEKRPTFAQIVERRL